MGSAGQGRILVTDGEQRSALAAVRSLGRAGYSVYVCSTRGRSLSGASRFCTAELKTPDPLRHPAHFARTVASITSREKIDWLLPIAEASILPVLDNLASFGHVGIPFPDARTFRRISDKEAVMREASRLGIAVPAQVVAPSQETAAGLSTGALRYPLVLKPSRSITESNGRAIRLSVRHVGDAQELQRSLAAIPDAAYPVLVQERVVGPGIGVFLLVRDGSIAAAFSHRRIREKPPAGGVSVYRESRPLDPLLLERSSELLRAFDWKGVAMIEYKVDARTGTPYIMEINGRLWGSLQLAVDSGVDFPRLLIAAARGERPSPVLGYRSGNRLRWTLGEVDHLIALWRHSSDALTLPPEAPGLTRAFLDFLMAFRPGSRGEVLRLSDPLPGLREAIDWIRRR